MSALIRRFRENADARILLAALIAIGIALRLAQYLHNRELWADEAYLALDVANEPYGNLVAGLHYNMFFPVGFLYALKATVQALGTTEYALRLLPLIAGVLSIFLFAALAARTSSDKSCDQACGLNWPGVLAAVAFFAIGKHLVYYSSEVRHYSFDVALACLLYLLALPRTNAPETSGARRMLLWCVAGAVAVWFSLASVFVLAASGSVLFVESLERRDWRRAAVIAAGCALWAASFAIQLHLLHRGMAARGLTEVVAQHCESMSPPFPPFSVADLRAYRETWDHLFAFPGGFTYAGLAAFAFLVGCYALARKDARLLLMLVVLPFAYTFAACALRQYPFRNQYLLFLLPGILIAMAQGIGFLCGVNGKSWIAGALLFVMLAAQPMLQAAAVFATPRSGPGGPSCVTPLLGYARSHWQPNDVLDVLEGQEATCAYYSGAFGFVATPGPAAQHADLPVRARYVIPSLRSMAKDPTRIDRRWLLAPGHNEPPALAAARAKNAEAGNRMDTVHTASSTLYCCPNDLAP